LLGLSKVCEALRNRDVHSDRDSTFQVMQDVADEIHSWLTGLQRGSQGAGRGSLQFGREFGLELRARGPRTVDRDRNGWPTLEVHSVRPARRITSDGGVVSDVVIEITQKRRGYRSTKTQRKADRTKDFSEKPHFTFRGGCTLLIDLETGSIRYVIGKYIGSERRLERQRAFVTDRKYSPLRETYARSYGLDVEREPFAILHRSFNDPRSRR
jgi:hypothetical protein